MLEHLIASEYIFFFLCHKEIRLQECKGFFEYITLFYCRANADVLTTMTRAANCPLLDFCRQKVTLFRGAKSSLFMEVFGLRINGKKPQQSKLVVSSLSFFALINNPFIVSANPFSFLSS